MSTTTALGSLHLKIFHNQQLVEEKTLTGGVVKIGRLESSHVRLDDGSVARMHAVIEASGTDVRVIDLGSTTGTSINGRRIEKHAALASGDELQIGPYRVKTEILGSAVRATRPAMQIDTSAVEVADGRRVAEVTAVFGDTVVDMQHVGQVRSRRASAPAFMAVGGLMLFAGAALFAGDVAQDWDGHRERVEAAHEAGRPAPAEPGTGLGSLGIALAFLGLVPLGLGAVRMRDVGLTEYTIGEGHGATLQVSPRGLPEEDGFALVRDGEQGPVVAFTPGMRGEVCMGGRSMSLADLAHRGHAASVGTSHAFPLPPDATCTVEHAGLTFHVKSVAPGRVIARKPETDRPFWTYNAASLAALGSLLVLMHLVPDDALAMGLEDSVTQSRFVGYMNQPDLVPDDEPIDESNESDDDAGGTGQRHAGAEGQMGNPTSKQQNRVYTMKGPKDATPQMARNFDPSVAASRAGILGMIEQETGHFLASPYGGAFAVGNHDEDLWGGLTGTEVGESFGVGGLGLVGTGRGGGGGGEGTIGLGRVGTIGQGGGGGGGVGYGRGAGVGLGSRVKKGPIVRASQSIVHGALDKDVIRRIVRNHINEVRYCYNQGLVRDPNLAGRVSVQFTIGPTGKVAAAVVQESSLADRGAANCIATAVKRWTFPKPVGGGNVMVTYPFVLQPG